MDGFIIVDLPAEQAGDFHPKCVEHGLSLVPIVAPTSTPERVAAAARLSDSFIYVVSVLGVTGARTSVNTEACDRHRHSLDRRAVTCLPATDKTRGANSGQVWSTFSSTHFGQSAGTLRPTILADIVAATQPMLARLGPYLCPNSAPQAHGRGRHTAGLCQCVVERMLLACLAGISAAPAHT